MRLIPIQLFIMSLIFLTSSCKKTSEGETVASWNKIYRVNIVKFEHDIITDRIIKIEDTKEFSAPDDNTAAKEGFKWYLAGISTFCLIYESSNGGWLSIPYTYFVYDENGHLISEIKGKEKQDLIKIALSNDDIQTYKENLPPYHFKYSSLMYDDSVSMSK